jgi:hypothetical protein
MKMTREQLARVAKNLEASIADLQSVEQVEAAVGRDPDGNCVDDAHSGEEYVEVVAHPAQPGTFVIQYVRRTGQTPIQVVVSPPRKRIKLMLSCTEALPGYEVFDEEPDFGKMQDKSLPLDLKALHAELAQLSSLA